MQFSIISGAPSATLIIARTRIGMNALQIALIETKMRSTLDTMGHTILVPSK
jgi:hypothetical protein